MAVKDALTERDRAEGYNPGLSGPGPWGCDTGRLSVRASWLGENIVNGRTVSASNVPPTAGRSSAILWTGRILSGLAAAFLTFDAAMKVLRLPMAVEGTVALGYPAHTVFGIGLLQVVCLALYLIPRTSLLGAVLWTGYLGGAIATQVRVGNPLFTHVLFPIYVAALLWGGLYLRDSRVRVMLAPSEPERR
jgi:hypothetical protein